MNKTILKTTIGAVCLTLSAAVWAEGGAAKKPGKAIYKDWRLIGLSHRLENKTLRAVLGNDTAIDAARAGTTKPWPDGTVLAKVVWKERQHPNWPQAVVPGDFAAAEAMIKDSKKYAATGGWGFAHWVDNKLEMHEPETSAKCFACHTPMKDNDYVFTFDALQ